MQAKAHPTPTYDVPTLPDRPADMHKGLAGHVAVISGSRGMSGAAILVGMGALRSGAGLVRVYCAQSILPIIAGYEPSLLTVPLPEDEEGRLACAYSDPALDLDWASVVAIGPGLGRGGALPALVQAVVSKHPGPLVVDADGLNNLGDAAAKVWEARGGRPTVITPHPGEMARLRKGLGLDELSGKSDETRLRIAHEYASRTQTTVVLKGHRTVVCTPEQAFINQTGNPGMATGGMGDVLTGVTAALIGQGMSTYDAARLAVHVHGRAGDYCSRDIGPIGYLPRELADAVPAALADANRPQIGFQHE